jgi:aminoglycoside 6-adenylyltransferase
MEAAPYAKVARKQTAYFQSTERMNLPMNNSNNSTLQALLGFARRDDNIRAVLMEGSRAFGRVDGYSDYDIVYVTRSSEPYFGSAILPFLTGQFGGIAVMQTPDNGDPHDVYTHLIQFESGIRIDLTFNSLAFLSRTKLESATVVLLDKDGSFTETPAPSDADFWLKPPDKAEFRSRCNQFWWVSPYVAKAVARGQTLHALELLSQCVRDEYAVMLSWLAGVRKGWEGVNPGKHLTDIKKLLSPEDLCYYEILLDSYVPADGGKIRAALDSLMPAYQGLALTAASGLGYAYDSGEGERTMAFIRGAYPK